MSIGAGIFLLVVGAILSFGVSPDTVSVINLQVIGYICMAAGVVGIVLGFVMQSQRRRTSTHVVQERYDNPPGVVPPREP